MLTIEPFLEIFPFGSPSFGRLSSEFRRPVVEEAFESDLPGLVFTFVWGLQLDEDAAWVQSYVDLVKGRGGAVSFVDGGATRGASGAQQHRVPSGGEEVEARPAPSATPTCSPSRSTR